LTATLAWLVEEADAALDEAKGAGRNTFAVRPNVEIGAQAALQRAQKGCVRPLAEKQPRKTSQSKHLVQVHQDSRRSWDDDQSDHCASVKENSRRPGDSFIHR
jgi:hypothetical protein